MTPKFKILAGVASVSLLLDQVTKYLVETRMVFGENKKIREIVPVERNDAHRLIEECMVTANVCAARYLKRHRLAGVYRNHDGPADEKLLNLTRME